MAKKKAGKNNIPLPILIVICAVLLYAMYVSISTLALAILGESVMGTVDSFGSQPVDTGAKPNRSRVVSKGYRFMANGKEYRGHVIYSSDEAWPSLKVGETRSERIRYLPFFPHINKPAMLSDFDDMGGGAIIYHIFTPIGCLLLLLLVIRTVKDDKKKKAKRKPAADTRRTGSQIIETRSETEMFCHNCGNKLPQGAVFCSNCGEKHRPTHLLCARPAEQSFRTTPDFASIAEHLQNRRQQILYRTAKRQLTHPHRAARGLSASPTGITTRKYKPPHKKTKN